MVDPDILNQEIREKGGVKEIKTRICELEKQKADVQDEIDYLEGLLSWL